MKGHPTIYTDGHSLDVSPTESEHLRHLGLVESHPGAGLFGIERGDLRLTTEASWEQVTDALADLHHS